MSRESGQWYGRAKRTKNAQQSGEKTSLNAARGRKLYDGLCLDRVGDRGVVHPTQTTWSEEGEVPQRKSKVLLRKDNVGQAKTTIDNNSPFSLWNVPI